MTKGSRQLYIARALAVQNITIITYTKRKILRFMHSNKKNDQLRLALFIKYAWNRIEITWENSDINKKKAAKTRDNKGTSREIFFDLFSVDQSAAILSNTKRCRLALDN